MNRLPEEIKSTIPDELVPAVEALTKSLDDAYWKCALITEVFCYSLLHSGERLAEVEEHKPALGQLKAIVGPAIIQSCDRHIKTGTAPAFFHAMFEMYKAGVAVQAVEVFEDLREIGRAHEERLGKPHVQWAHDLTLELAKIYEIRPKMWIRAVCDPPDFGTDLNWDDPDEIIMGKTWCAPLLIVMRPSRYMPFDETRQWDRADRETSKGWLNSLAQFFTIHIKLHIDRLADEKTVELAKKPKRVDALHSGFEVHQFDAPQTGTTEDGNRLSEQVGKSHSVFTWKNLEIRFRGIQSELTRGKASASFIPTESHSNDGGKEWVIGGSATWRKQFDHLASIASRKLGYIGSEGAAEYWLDRVREWMQQAGLDKDKNVAWRPFGEGGFYMERIAELSAMYCMELIVGSSPETTVSLPSELPESEATKSKQRRNARKVPRTKAELNRLRVVFGAIQAGLRGARYCAALDDRRLRLPHQWTEEGCPSTYSLAYQDKRWQHRIQDEKSRYREQYEMTPPKEREAIIEGENGTRHTRH